MLVAPPTLDILDLDLLLCICEHLPARGLARLKCVSHRYSVADTAAELASSRRHDGWRVAARDGESAIFRLFVCERLLAPLPVVSATRFHGLVVTAGGGLSAFGSNADFQLGLTDDPGSDLEPELDEDDQELEFGCADPRRADVVAPRPIERLAGRTVVAASAGWAHSAALTNDGRLLTWGSYGERLGLGVNQGVVGPPCEVSSFPPETRVALVAAGVHDTLCVTANGDLYSWGETALGHAEDEDGAGPSQDWVGAEPVRVDALAARRVVSIDHKDGLAIAVTSAGKLFLFCAGWNLPPPVFHYLNPTPAPVPFSGVLVRDASCSSGHVAAVASDGRLFTWGEGAEGKLGHGDEEDVMTPRVVSRLQGRPVGLVSCGTLHTAATTDGGSVLWTWGSGSFGCLGHGSEENRLEPTEVVLDGFD